MDGFPLRRSPDLVTDAGYCTGVAIPLIAGR